VPVGAVWKPDALTAPVASHFIEVLAQTCGNGTKTRQQRLDERNAVGDRFPSAADVIPFDHPVHCVGLYGEKRYLHASIEHN
jgi:hypothetical protein